MKKFIRKHLSIILSFAIVLTTLLPVLTGLAAALFSVFFAYRMFRVGKGE
jgi:hypothetical protein